MSCEWGWEQLRPWLDARIEPPVRSLFCIIADPLAGDGRPLLPSALMISVSAGPRL